MSAIHALSLLLALQEPAPPPPTTDAPPPTERTRRLREAVRESTTPHAAAEDKAAPAPQPKRVELTPLDRFGRLVSSGPLHYAFYYAPDYAAVAALGALSAGIFIRPPPASPRAAFGPSYDPDRRDSSEVMDHRYDRLLGGQFRKDTVPVWLPAAVGNPVILSVGVMNLVTTRSFRKFHHLVLGALEAQLAAHVVNELTKSATGRLRPDYRDRMTRYYCSGKHGDVPDGISCGTAWREAEQTHGYWLTEDEFENGSRSFPSGHATNAFALATYLSLFLGGEYVWGESATAATRIPAVAAQAAALTAAAFVGATRITDNRHHPEDVLVGAGLGAGMAAAFYFVHFDLQGRPYVRSVSFAPFATTGGMGIGFRGVVP